MYWRLSTERSLDFWPGRVRRFRPRGESARKGSRLHCLLCCSRLYLSLCCCPLSCSTLPCTKLGRAGLTRGQLASEECWGASGGFSGEQTSFQAGGVTAFMTEALRQQSSSHIPLFLLDRNNNYSFGVGQGVTAGTSHWLDLRT